ncbi:hypothetical protein CMV_007269 [Castanea mollissima]|uniref:Programmed cell death protein 4-like n=1 Tax=Castanea mollissima TaxID=60419 RepID=A0A8J4W2Y9_9ROSI|nr:hypothetical protein CMV_007269 [Castanea mollissima]
MKKTGKSYDKPNGILNERKDRKSGTGMSGSPKKRGHGGKFTWVGDGYSQPEIGFESGGVFYAKDPNFEDPDESFTV